MQHNYVFHTTDQAPEPKNQTEAPKRPDAQDWIDSEWVEMDMIYSMGTTQIVYIKNSDLPLVTTIIPTKFVYKYKFGDQGQEIRKKGCLTICGDLQNETEYTETFTQRPCSIRYAL